MHKIKCYFTYAEMTGEGEEWIVESNTYRVLAKLFNGELMNKVSGSKTNEEVTAK